MAQTKSNKAAATPILNASSSYSPQQAHSNNTHSAQVTVDQLPMPGNAHIEAPTFLKPEESTVDNFPQKSSELSLNNGSQHQRYSSPPPVNGRPRGIVIDHTLVTRNPQECPWLFGRK